MRIFRKKIGCGGPATIDENTRAYIKKEEEYEHTGIER